MRLAIWNAMLDADMNSRYWRCLVNRYSSRDKTFKIFLAVMASGTVATWGLWATVPWLWKGLSSISAIVAIILPIMNYQKLIGQMSSLGGKWGELRIEYEDLWIQVRNHSKSQSLEAAYSKFRKIEAGLQEVESELPDDQDLLRKCFEDVKRVRGLDQNG